MTLAVHPRVCGEQRRTSARALISAGSSPRVRGTGYVEIDDFKIRRFIPACAGNRSAVDYVFVGGPVHPRVCGEQNTRLILTLRAGGSSPRVRGTDPSSKRWGGHIRFIPACAGNSSRIVSYRTFRSVHPRVCGEQFDSDVVKNAWIGSSPRVRGTGWSWMEMDGAGRFIPACAGNRCRLGPGKNHAPVHPRVCGEQSPGRRICWRIGGSSPRVRGTAPCPPYQSRTKRFIPACAGNRATCWQS